ncbi:uncharacterized protein LOC144452428 [Glandiceps talaboti]
MKIQVATLLIFLVTLLAFKQVSAISCLQCSGIGYNDCGGKWSEAKKMKALPCPKAEHTWCYVQREDDNEGRITYSAYDRGCSEFSVGNYCNVGEIMSTCYSSCNADGCNRDNSASGLQVSVVVWIMDSLSCGYGGPLDD